jgi:hypothetical protein
MKMIGYGVGSPLPFSLPANISNGAYFYFDRTGCELIAILESPTHEIISDFKAKARSVFGLYKKGSVLFLLFKFGNQPWCDSPFHMHIKGEFKGGIPEDYTPGSLLSLSVILVDSRGNRNIVKVIRYLTFGREFSRRLVEAGKTQIANPISLHDFEKEVLRTYSLYPSSEDMVRDALIIEEGGK